MDFSKLIKLLVIIGLIFALINLDQVRACLKPYISRPKKIDHYDDVEEVEVELNMNNNLNVNELQNFLDEQIEIVQKKLK